MSSRYVNYVLGAFLFFQAVQVLVRLRNYPFANVVTRGGRGRGGLDVCGYGNDVANP